MTVSAEIASVSVIIPCYNSERTIRSALLSIVQQTLLPLEIICVDDCSRDRTIETIHAFADEFASCNIIVEALEQNGGPAIARNLGWDIAKGDYVTFLDSDDHWHPQKLELQVALMQRTGCFGSSHARATNLSETYSASDQTLPTFLITTTGLLFRNRIVTSAVMLKNVPNFRFRHGMRYCEDLQLWFEILFSGEYFIYMDVPLSSIYQGEDAPQGLSSAVIKMERGKQDIFLELFRRKLISLPSLLAALVFSVMKFVFRRIQAVVS